MLTRTNLIAILITLCAVCAAAQAPSQAPAKPAAPQDDAEARLRHALEGRQVLVKMDMPAIDSGVTMTFDDTKVTYDQATCSRMLKEYGAAIPKGAKARITGARFAHGGVELDLDGGGSPSRDWLVNNVRLVEPAPVAKSDRELELERQIPFESNAQTLNVLRTELELERQARLSQDMRNHDTFAQVSRYRSEYLKQHRKDWGTKLIVVIRSRKDTTSMRDIVKALADYVEVLPREPVPAAAAPKT